MPVISDYNQFDGRHWETGSVANYYAHLGVKAPHTGRPPSEALLMGISGGAVMAYFFFDYQGIDPHVRILTRNTFDPWSRMLSRLGVVQHVAQTTKEKKAVANLVDSLEEGLPAVVWADYFGLPYNGFGAPDAWAMLPILVYGYDEAADRVLIADRARVPLIVTTEILHETRARVKKDKFRVATFDPPNWDKLASAVRAGIDDCIKLYMEKPPKGTANNFGFKAFDFWINMLTNPKHRQSWAKLLADGQRLVGGLMSVYSDIELFGKDGHAERDLFARFLEESALILDRPGLNEVAADFRRSGEAWDALAGALLPDRLPPLAEIRRLMQQRHDLFLAQGGGSLAARQDLDGRIQQIRDRLAADFPLDAAGVSELREEIAGHVRRVRDIEVAAVEKLQQVMA